MVAYHLSQSEVNGGSKRNRLFGADRPDSDYAVLRDEFGGMDSEDMSLDLSGRRLKRDLGGHAATARELDCWTHFTLVDPGRHPVVVRGLHGPDQLR